MPADAILYQCVAIPNGSAAADVAKS